MSTVPLPNLPDASPATPVLSPPPDVEPLLRAIRSWGPEVPEDDLALVRRCFAFACERHAGQLRRSGDPYVVHPLSVAGIIADLKLDIPSVCAGLLHDCVEDTSATLEDLEREFGPEVRLLVDGVTKLGQIPWTSREERQAENFRKMLLAMARDLRVILIKLADRLDNMRTLGHMPREKQERIARETREIHAPMANRLGIQWIKTELEDLCFRYLEPLEWRAVAKKLAETEAARAGYIGDTSAKLREIMSEAGIAAEVTGRSRHLWSIFQKMRRTAREIEHIQDVIAFRVVVEGVRDCYTALGVVHTTFTPVPGRFKDYVALPKPNLYQSLHTTVIGPHAERMEVQIRTRDMHRVAEFGVATHWRRKDGQGRSLAGKERAVAGDTGDGAPAWLTQLMEWQRDLKDPTEFIETVKVDLFGEEVFVFTPRGDVKTLPKGSTPVDFAYAVHSKVGDQCSGARVNGLIVPLRYALRNGDTIDILTSPSQKPTKDWLKFVVTSRATTRIRNHLRLEQRERIRKYGHDLLARELRSADRNIASAERDGLLQAAATTLRAGSAEDLLVKIGYGRILPPQVAAAMYPTPGTVTPDAVGHLADDTTPQVRRTVRRSVGGVRVQGEADLVVKFGRCCSPVPGDSIVGFVSRGRGLVIHARECRKALDLDPDRRVEVGWDETVHVLRPVVVEVLSSDRSGLLAEVSKCFTDHGVNIETAKCKTTEDRQGINTFQVMVGHVDQLKTVLRAIQAIAGVTAATRL